MKSKDPENLSIKNLDIPCWEDREKHFKWLWHVVNGLSELSFPSLSDKKIFLIKVRSDMDDKYLNDSYPELLYVNGSDAVKEKRMKELEDPYLRKHLVNSFRTFYSEFLKDRMDKKIETLNNLIQAKVEKATLEKVEQKQDKNKSESKDFYKDFSKDCRSLEYKGKQFLVPAMQAAVIRLLLEAHKNGSPGLSGSYILEEIGATDRSKLKDIFRDSPLWQTLVASNRKGIYELSI